MAAIARVEVARFDYGLVGDFKFFRNGVRPTVVVRLTDDNGLKGFGQAVPVETWTYETVESVETTLRHYIAPAIVGAGRRLLDGLPAMRLESIASTTSPTGYLLVDYRVIR